MSQIKTSLELVRDKLNQHLSVLYPYLDDDLVVLSNFVNQDGQPYSGAQDKVVMFLAGVEHETKISTYNPNIPVKNNQFDAVSAPVYINLFVLFTANFHNKKNDSENYAQGIGFISEIISFFQQFPAFTHNNLPGMDESIDKLAFQIYNLDALQLNHILGITGTKYLPSVYYRARTLPFNSDAIQRTVPPAKGYKTPGQPRDGQAVDPGSLRSPPRVLEAETDDNL